MKWVFAGVAFALLIGLAVFTVATRSRNLAMRARIAEHDRHLMMLITERSRRDQDGPVVVPTAELLKRLRAQVFAPAAPE